MNHLGPKNIIYIAQLISQNQKKSRGTALIFHKSRFRCHPRPVPDFPCQVQGLDLFVDMFGQTGRQGARDRQCGPRKDTSESPGILLKIQISRPHLILPESKILRGFLEKISSLGLEICTSVHFPCTHALKLENQREV